MSNMSYCRFTNTLAALNDCYEHINDKYLSSEEEEARDLLILLCIKIAEEFR